MNQKRKQTTAAASTEHTSKRPRRVPYERRIQSFLLIWLDDSIDEVNNNDSANTISKLREVVNSIHTFTNVDECINFINDIKEEKTFIISSGTLGQTTVPIVHDMAQVSTIYIFCGNKSQHEQWVQQWPKVKGIFTDIKPICEALKKAAHECDQNNISMSFVATDDDITNKNLDQLDQSFMYTQILKEILLTIDFEQQHINDFISYCREQFKGNTKELKNVDKLQREYHQQVPIWWYTYHYFLYSTLNRALRMMEIDLIISMGFFIQDLHKHITHLHSEQFVGHTHSNTFTVYRGQGLTQTDFDKLVKTKGGLLSFNNFLSTSHDRAVSLAFAESIQYNPDMISVLFEITIDPSMLSTPFADIRNVSYFQGEEEILFCMHSIFRIGNIKNMDNNNNRLWQVELVLTTDNDPQLHALTERIREETKGSTGWLQLGKLMVKLAEYNKAENLYTILLAQKTNDNEKGNIFYQLGCIKYCQADYANAIGFYEDSLTIREKSFTSQHPDVADCYNDIGLVYSQMGEYTKALSYYEKALDIQQPTLPRNHPSLATSYNNIGLAYSQMNDCSKALIYYQKALEIDQNTLPSNHPSLATACNNIGLLHKKMGDYNKAFSYYEKALQIYQKTLPQTHPLLATFYINISGMYDSMRDPSNALSYYEKALEIEQKTLPPNHLDLAISYNNIGLVYQNMHEYTKALSYYEKALEIKQKTLPQNHPSLPTSYNNIGFVCNKMGEYSKALSYYEQDLEFRQKTLPPNHPVLAQSYNNIGNVYNKMGKYSKALSYYEKALEIRQKTLPPNRAELATSYNNIGNVYNRMGQYSKALSYYEKALEIYQKTIPPNPPFLATSYYNIGLVYENMGEYSKALSHCEKALEIRQKTLPPNHADLATSYNNIGNVYNKMGEYSKAPSYHEKALEIYQKTLPPNHPSLATSYYNIGLVYENMGEYSKALSHYEKALEIRQKILPPNHPSLLLLIITLDMCITRWAST